ncbi:MAG: zinc ribbon domain-containing protein, partial [Pseudomonadota bacterium]
IDADFPLRGFVACDDCGGPLTSCWSTSKTGKKHPYYMCFRKGCGSYRKSIRRDRIEGAFEDLLASLTPAQTLFALMRRMFEDAWSHR